MKIRLDQMVLPTLQCHTAMASEAFTLKTLGTSLLMHDKDDINYTCVLQYWYYLGLFVSGERRREHTSSRGAEPGTGVLLATSQ